eukprot:2043562-Lingulodinium_polyedra.AAC.1
MPWLLCGQTAKEYVGSVLRTCGIIELHGASISTVNVHFDQRNAFAFLMLLWSTVVLAGHS